MAISYAAPISVKPRGVDNHYTHASGRQKTVCTSHVLAELGIDSSTYKYSHSVKTMMQVLRRRWSARSVKSWLPKNASVGAARTTLATLSATDPNIVSYVVCVPGHAMLLDRSGATIVDTDPRKRDRRKVSRIYAIRNKQRTPQVQQEICR